MELLQIQFLSPQTSPWSDLVTSPLFSAPGSLCPWFDLKSPQSI